MHKSRGAEHRLQPTARDPYVAWRTCITTGTDSGLHGNRRSTDQSERVSATPHAEHSPEPHARLT
jgi:hypothetical protein